MSVHVWAGTATAISSIAHGVDRRGATAMLRRETMLSPSGSREMVPVISGNTLRGSLRRMGEAMLREVVQYEGSLSPAAAHLLRGGGALAKATTPLTGARLQTVRAWVPQLGVFGGAAAGIIIDGCLGVDKLVPIVAETRHITGRDTSLTLFDVTQIEEYTKQDENTSHDTLDTDAGSQMRFGIETFTAGTQFTFAIRLHHPTDLEHAFFSDLFTAFTRYATVGGRRNIGHGHLRFGTETPVGKEPTLDWRDYLREHRSDVIEALEMVK